MIVYKCSLSHSFTIILYNKLQLKIHRLDSDCGSREVWNLSSTFLKQTPYFLLKRLSLEKREGTNFRSNLIKPILKPIFSFELYVAIKRREFELTYLLDFRTQRENVFPSPLRQPWLCSFRFSAGKIDNHVSWDSSIRYRFRV